MLVFAIAAPLVMANRDLFEHAVNGMLEVPSALFTLAATAAWLASRDTKTPRPWAVALLGNLLFHAKFQHGLPSRIQTCSMWVKFLARERGAEVVVRSTWARPGPHEVLVLADGSEPLEVREKLVPDGPELRFGPVRGRRYRSIGP